MDMVIETGALCPHIFWQIPVAGAELIELVNQFDSIFYRRRTGIGSEIFGMILFHHSGKKHSRICLPYRHLNIRIGFIVLQHGIIFGTMLFDQIIFQNKCFQFRVRDNIFKPADQCNHLVNLGTPTDIFAEIGSDTVVQIDGFSHINNGVRFIMHDVDTGTFREFL